MSLTESGWTVRQVSEPIARDRTPLECGESQFAMGELPAISRYQWQGEV